LLRGSLMPGSSMTDVSAGTGGNRRGGAMPMAPITDLLCDASTLAGRLREALRDEDWLNAYLFAAGLSQLVDDRLHPDPLRFHRAARYLRDRPSRPARLLCAVAAGLGAAVRADVTPAGRRLIRARQPLAELTLRLAGQVLMPQHAGEERPADLALLLDASLRGISLTADDLLRLPSCFHSFDQHPDDVRWLARAFRERYPQRDRPLCVVGVRTSGSYLAPLHAAALRADRQAPAGQLTYRPGRPFLRWERAALRTVVRADGLILLVDDPPGAGNALATAARALTRAGVPGSRIVLLLSLFGGRDELPEVLQNWATVVQPQDDWCVHRRLAVQPVRDALVGLLSPEMEVREAEPLGAPYTAGERGHLRARFAVRLADRRTGEEAHRTILVEGAGLGYLGRQGVAVAQAIPGYVPRVYGFADGLLYRDWLPPAADRAGAAAGPAPAEAAAGSAMAGMVAGYVDARRRALPAPSASVDGLSGRDPAWEVAAKILAGQYGRLSVLIRPLLLEPLVRRLLAHADPAVLDGKTDLRHWLPDPAAAGKMRKVDFYQRSFGHLDLACYDPVFDLAGAAADPPTHFFEEELRGAYERISGERIDGERWLLYRLAQLRRFGAAGDLIGYEVRRLSAAAVHDYLSGLYLRDLPPASGSLCAIDLDGVLECGRLGFPATSPTGMLALRALIAHGYRPVLATGRSVPEVRDRCRAFGLAGGVAEYGAAVYSEGEAADLRPLGAAALLDQIRKELSGHVSVEVDPSYRFAVRARTGSGPLPTGLIHEIPALSDPHVRIIHGVGQTDITLSRFDKGTGLAALAARLPGEPDCALAIGDTLPDVPLLARADLARAPRNARFGSGAADIRRTRGAYQAGLSEACAELLGHRPGRCSACHVPGFTPRTKAMLTILDLRASGLATILSRTATLGALAVSGSRLSYRTRADPAHDAEALHVLDRRVSPGR
jgi:hydroxymethylpyrimidine pyrophosphatase-like HAD family hydrolase